MYEVAIIGGGPAGLAAAMYCIRKGLDVQLITATLGGKSTLGLTLPDMSEYHIIKAREQVRTFQARIEYLNHTWRRGRVVDVIETDAGFEIMILPGGSKPAQQIETERIVVATGTTPSLLHVPGESEFFGSALGSSAISYSHLLRDRKVVVVGDSDRAIEAAMECSEQSADVVLVVEPHASYSHRHLEFVARHDNIDVYNGYRVVRIDGGTFAESITLCRGDHASDNCGPEKRIEADAFFIEREPTPNSSVVSHLVERTPNGAIRINERNETSNKRIFAAGDVTTVGVEQVLVALGEGARAGLSAYRQHTMQV